MPKTILVPVTGNDTDSAVFKGALDVAARFGGHIDFLYVRPSPGEMAANLAVEGGVGLSAGLMDRLEEEAAAQQVAARALVQRFADGAKLALGAERAGTGGVTAGWHAKEGRENEWIPRFARSSDLTVLGRPARFGAEERIALEAALFDSGRPVLLPTEGALAIETIAVAWKSSRESARAIGAAAPFLAKAKRVVVLTAREGGQEAAIDTERLVVTLRRLYAAVEHRHLDAQSRNTAQMLLTAAGEAGAGLLVMGAYGHSRLREWVFGGVTENMLRGATIPVLMVH
ncbi:MAG: universal stress protein [Alphaproteobacteria bacterium]|nr:universal stress protein [Alphaproteobacteria bacterium]